MWRSWPISKETTTSVIAGLKRKNHRINFTFSFPRQIRWPQSNDRNSPRSGERNEPDTSVRSEIDWYQTNFKQNNKIFLPVMHEFVVTNLEACNIFSSLTVSINVPLSLCSDMTDGCCRLLSFFFLLAWLSEQQTQLQGKGFTKKKKEEKKPWRHAASRRVGIIMLVMGIPFPPRLFFFLPPSIDYVLY